MKRSLLFFALLTPQLFAQASSYTSFIRQIQDGVTKQTGSIAASGSSTSLSAISEGGSVFQLWTVQNSNAVSYLLDTKVVGAYLPKGTVTLTTNDPTGEKWGIKRTRIDQPFTVKTVVSGLLASGTGIPEAATKVIFAQHIGTYTNHIPNLAASEILATTPVTSAYLTQNVTSTLNFTRSSLYVVSPTQSSGEEHFVLRALADGKIAQTQLSADYVQVWPMATASIAGVTDNQVIKGKAPKLTITYTNLYPSSTTRIIAYPSSDPSKAIVLPRSEVSRDQDRNYSTTFTLEDYDAALPTDGTYTIDVITTTPFTTNEKLASANGKTASITGLVVDKTIQVRAMQVGGSE